MENTRPAEGDDSTHTLFFGEAAKKAPQRADEDRQGAGDMRQPHRSKVQMPEGDVVPF